MKKIVSFLMLLLVAAGAGPAQAGKLAPIDDPKEFSFAGKQKPPIKKVRAILEEAMSRSSGGSVNWTVVKERPGEIEATMGKTNNFARVGIHYDRNAIALRYRDNEGLKYRERRGKRYIHRAYNKWLKDFGNNLVKAAKTVASVTLFEGSRAAAAKAAAAGKAIVAVAVRAEPSNESITTAKWSPLATGAVAAAVTEFFGAKAAGDPLPWDRSSSRLAKKGYSRKLNKLACQGTGAQGIATVRIIDNEVPDPAGFREATYTYYNCGTDVLKQRTYVLEATKGDAFPLETSLKATVRKFFNESGVF